jgi:hypothetical protein
MPSVDMGPSRRLAYAFVEPACADPRHFIRMALEQRGGDPPCRLAASSHGAMMVVFKHAYFRETSIRRGPIDFGGFRLTLIRHEEAEFRVICPYSRLVEIAATNYPPEHWNEAGIRRSFQVFGQVCCVDKKCLRRVTDLHGDDGIADFSAVRVLVLLDIEAVVTSLLLVRNPKGEVSGFAKLRLVDWWDHPADAPTPNDYDFPGDLRDDDGDDDEGDDDDNDDDSRVGRYSPSWSGPLTRTGCRACPVFPSFRARGESSTARDDERRCRELGVPLFPSVPLWTFVAGTAFAVSRALSLAGVPRVVIRDLPTPVRPGTPPPAPPPSLSSEIEEVARSARRGHAPMPTLRDLLAAEEHEVTIRRRRVRHRRATESASKVRRSRRLASKEDPLYTDATAKATRVKAAQLDLSKASERMKKALEQSGVLERPPPARVPSAWLRCLGRVCCLPHLSEVEDDVVS